MPNIKSAKKRVSVGERRREENRYVKSTMATMIKKFRQTAEIDPAKAEKMLGDIVSYIDSASTKGVIHQNTASRKISRLNLLLNKAKASKKVEDTPVQATEEAEKAAPTKKVAQKKVATKKSPAKRATKKAE